MALAIWVQTALIHALSAAVQLIDRSHSLTNLHGSFDQLCDGNGTLAFSSPSLTVQRSQERMRISTGQLKFDESMSASDYNHWRRRTFTTSIQPAKAYDEEEEEEEEIHYVHTASKGL